jgi:hypothetical protein
MMDHIAPCKVPVGGAVYRVGALRGTTLWAGYASLPRQTHPTHDGDVLGAETITTRTNNGAVMHGELRSC